MKRQDFEPTIGAVNKKIQTELRDLDLEVGGLKHDPDRIMAVATLASSLADLITAVTSLEEDYDVFETN